MGAYCNGILSVLSPDLWVDSDNEVVIRERFMEDGPVVHELTHLVLDKKYLVNILCGLQRVWHYIMNINT